MRAPALQPPHGWPNPSCARLDYTDASTHLVQHVCWTCWTWLGDWSRFQRSGQVERNLADAYRPEGTL